MLLASSFVSLKIEVKFQKLSSKTYFNQVYLFELYSRLHNFSLPKLMVLNINLPIENRESQNNLLCFVSQS